MLSLVCESRRIPLHTFHNGGGNVLLSIKNGGGVVWQRRKGKNMRQLEKEANGFLSSKTESLYINI